MKIPFSGIYILILFMFCLKHITTIKTNTTDSLMTILDDFIIVKDYVKTSIYTVSNKLLQEKKQQQSKNSKSVQQIDADINKMSKSLCKALSSFIRKKEIIYALQNRKTSFDFFILPDTMLKKSKIQYYQFLVEICKNITGIEFNIDQTEHNCKLYISSL